MRMCDSLQIDRWFQGCDLRFIFFYQINTCNHTGHQELVTASASPARQPTQRCTHKCINSKRSWSTLATLPTIEHHTAEIFMIWMGHCGSRKLRRAAERCTSPQQLFPSHCLIGSLTHQTDSTPASSRHYHYAASHAHPHAQC